MFFHKGESVDRFKRMTALRVDLAHAIDKRDALASDVTALSAQIAELEARLSGVEKGIGLLKDTTRPGRDADEQNLEAP
jgi:hypothetical protein